MKLSRQKIQLLYVRTYLQVLQNCLIIEAEPVVSVLHLFLYDEHKQSHDTTSLQFQQWWCSAKMAAMFMCGGQYYMAIVTRQNTVTIKQRYGRVCVYSRITPSYNYAIRLLRLFPLKMCFNRILLSSSTKASK